MKLIALVFCALTVLAGCARQPHSVAWYTSHPAAAKAMWARCHAGQDLSRPDCQRAGEVTANIKEAAAEARARAATAQAMSDLPKGPPPPMPTDGAQLDKEPNWAYGRTGAQAAAKPAVAQSTPGAAP